MSERADSFIKVAFDRFFEMSVSSSSVEAYTARK